MNALRAFGIAGVLAVSMSGTASAAEDSGVPAQLRAESFAFCLREAANGVPDLAEIRSRHGLGAFDLLLTYLAVYPGVRAPAPWDRYQDRARDRWSEAWGQAESGLAADLLQDPRVSPAEFLSRAIGRCGDAFCGALIAHTVLRTLGRYQRGGAYNPGWFEQDRDRWIAGVESVREGLYSLRTDGGGDRYGEWYHFFGLLAYGLRDAALHRGLMRSGAVARLNELLNPVLAGGREDPIKARLDRDSVRVVAEFVNAKDPRPYASCSTREAYVHAQNLVEEPR